MYLNGLSRFFDCLLQHFGSVERSRRCITLNRMNLRGLSWKVSERMMKASRRTTCGPAMCLLFGALSGANGKAWLTPPGGVSASSEDMANVASDWEKL